MILRLPRAIATMTLIVLMTFAAGTAPAQPPAPPATRVQHPLIKEAELLVEEGKLPEALAVYRKAIAAEPTLVDAHLGAGRTLDLTGQHAEARKSFATAIDLATPDTKPQALTSMAISYAFESKAAESARFYEQVFAARMAQGNPGSAAGTANAIARIYLESRDLTNAAKWYRTGYDTSKQIKDLTPAQTDLWEMRWINAQARIAARRGDAAQARNQAAALKALADKPGNEGERPQYQYLLGYIALEAGDNDTAIAELEKGNLTDSFVLGLIGRAYEKKRDSAKATEFARKVMAATGHSINTAFAHQWARKYLKQ
jgi:hypothetical protein